jgi:hypothetical protein
MKTKLAILLLFAATTLHAAENKPSILFCSPQGVGFGWVHLQYLQELRAHGFEVDYTESPSDVTWDRIKRYNTILLYMMPEGYDFGLGMYARPSSPDKITNFVALIERYLEAGGGVFLMPREHNVKKQSLADLTGRWGVRLPVETITESDPAKVGNLTQASHDVPLAFTDQVLDSPVSAGVKRIWYPINPAYNGAQGGPIEVDGNWQVVVKASATAVTKPVDLSKTGHARIENPFQRAGGVKEPALFAIRQYKAGRIAIVNQWPQFSVGSGTQFIFNREVLSKGLKGKPSDFGKLLENTYRWLAEPSLAGKGVGGYVTKEETLVAPNRREAARKQFEFTFRYREEDVMQWRSPPRFALPYRGLIGAKTTYSSGKGAVKEYAAAAKKAGLQFVVFLDDFDKLTPETFAKLKADCRQYSDDQLLLVPGFTIQANTGDHMFFYSPDGPWPPENVLTGPGKKLYALQPQDKDGKFTGYLGDSFNWMFEYHGDKGNIGYYHFTSRPSNMRISDLRLYGAAAIRYYKEGKLVEDMTDDYLTCAQATIPPAPVVFNEVRSPAELAREVERGHALTYVQARTIPTIFKDGLWWPHQYVSYNTFASDGPIIHEWPATVRVITLGAEEFVTIPAIMPSRITVSAERGLKEIAIYDGRELFRRFLPGGAKEFHTTLVLNATVQRNLVLIATDMKGRKAVSFARRSWKDGARAPVSCSDRVNDCGGMLLAHGPMATLTHFCPVLPDDVAGYTWDGGPPANIPFVLMQENRPILDTDKGQETGRRFNQTPLLEFSDEGALAVASEQNRLFSDELLNVVNPWHTFGPLAGPTKLFDFINRYREWVNPTVGLPETGWAGPGVRAGMNAGLYRCEIRFKDDFTIQQLDLLVNNQAPKVQPAYFAYGHPVAQVEKVIDITAPGATATIKLQPGDWFAYFSPRIAGSHIFIVREQPLVMLLHGGHFLLRADIEKKAVKKGRTFTYELFSLGAPVDVNIRKIEDVQRRLTYLNQPEGWELLRGNRQPSLGPLELVPGDGAVEFRVPKPKEPTDLTLPVRVTNLKRRWTVGLWQKRGYVKGDYGTGDDRYRELGVDAYNNAYVPVYVDKADVTHMVAGHPLVADENGKELFIQVTHVYESPHQWHVAVNNPTDRKVTTTLRKAIDLPGFLFTEQTITLEAGEYRVLL